MLEHRQGLRSNANKVQRSNFFFYSFFFFLTKLKLGPKLDRPELVPDHRARLRGGERLSARANERGALPQMLSAPGRPRGLPVPLFFLAWRAIGLLEQLDPVRCTFFFFFFYSDLI
jgi:hypothetical protein